MKEITPEIKQKIFALYYDKQIMMHDGNKRPLLINSGTIALGLTPNYYIELTPLSQITDEDAIKVAKICGYDFKNTQRCSEFIEVKQFKNKSYQESIRIYSNGWVEFDDGIPYEGSFASVPVAVFDFLRSSGYALPAFGYSVEALVKAGVFKLKTNPAKTQ